MKILIDIPQGLKIDFENENWTALTCAEMKEALMHSTPLPKGLEVVDKIRAEMELHRRKTESIDPYDLVGDCLDIIDRCIVESEDVE